MPIFALSFDFDNCLSHCAHQGTPIESIVSVNQKFFDNLTNRLATKTIEKQYTLIGSNRQSRQIDALNARSNGNGSCFESIKYVNDYLGATFISLLMADIDKRLEIGCSFNRAIDPGYTGSHAEWMFDDSKVRLLYAQIHHVAMLHPNGTIFFDFYDDRPDILDNLISFYGLHKELIPSNVTLTLYHYQGTDTTESKVIAGNGFIDEAYQQTAIDLAHFAADNQGINKDSLARGNRSVNVARHANNALLSNRKPLDLSFLNRLSENNERCDEKIPNSEMHGNSDAFLNRDAPAEESTIKLLFTQYDFFAPIPSINETVNNDNCCEQQPQALV